MRVVDRRGDRVDVSKVFDKVHNIKTGSEALTVWRNHFEEVLNSGQSPGVCEEARSPERIRDLSGPLDSELTREEVR